MRNFRKKKKAKRTNSPMRKLYELVCLCVYGWD